MNLNANVGQAFVRLLGLRLNIPLWGLALNECDELYRIAPLWCIGAYPQGFPMNPVPVRRGWVSRPLE